MIEQQTVLNQKQDENFLMLQLQTCKNIKLNIHIRYILKPSIQIIGIAYH